MCRHVFGEANSNDRSGQQCSPCKVCEKQVEEFVTKQMATKYSPWFSAEFKPGVEKLFLSLFIADDDDGGSDDDGSVSSGNATEDNE